MLYYKYYGRRGCRIDVRVKLRQASHKNNLASKILICLFKIPLKVPFKILFKILLVILIEILQEFAGDFTAIIKN